MRREVTRISVAHVTHLAARIPAARAQAHRTLLWAYEIAGHADPTPRATRALKRTVLKMALISHDDKLRRLPFSEPADVIDRYLADVHRRVLAVINDIIEYADGADGPNHRPELPPMHPFAYYADPAGRQRAGEWARAAMTAARQAHEQAGGEPLYTLVDCAIIQAYADTHAPPIPVPMPPPLSRSRRSRRPLVPRRSTTGACGPTPGTRSSRTSSSRGLPWTASTPLRPPYAATNWYATCPTPVGVLGSGKR